MQLSRGAGDHCNPAVAIDSAGVLYAVWQENARGVWNVCLSVSADGRVWSDPIRITDSSDNQVNPAIAAGMQPGGLVAVTWQGDAAGNQDIYVASSTDGFATVEVAQATTDEADQTEPAVAIDDEDTIVVLWTDARNASSDIYGAASSDLWTNVPVVDVDSNQSEPAVAVGSAGRVLHIAWTDDLGGDTDIFYGASEGLPLRPLAGVDLIDDASRADQRAPSLAVAVAEDGIERVLTCWVDSRNRDTDLYTADAGDNGPRANVLVGGESLESNQNEVCLGVAVDGRPYLVWTDDAGGTRRVYCSLATAGESMDTEIADEP